MEANEKNRAEYLKTISEIDPKKLVYSDETGIDDNEVCLSGWAPRGSRCYSKKPAFRNTRYNITAALLNGKLIAPFLFEGYSTQAVYETYIEKVLLPLLAPGMFLIIDNARFHKSRRVVDLIEGAGCQVVFLPPYSPDLNPIEHWWASVKQAIKRAAEQIDNFYEAAIQGIAKMCTA